jgi:acetyl-CoA C-acetyltransferase
MRRVAIVGAGMTKFVRRAQETGPELSYLATKKALDSCQMNIKDIDVVTHGTAPDAFDGVHMKGEYLLGGSGGQKKPYIRNFVGGGTGVFAPIHGWMHVASGMADTCAVVCEEKMSTCHPHPAGAFLTIFDHTTEQPLYPTLIWIFALEMKRYMERYGLNRGDIAKVAVKNKNNALDHPCAQVAQACTLEDILSSEVLADPVHRLDISPASDGACAVILASEEKAKKLTDKPIWLDGVGWNVDTAYWGTRDLYYPEYVEKAARMAYDMAGIKEPSKEIHVAEPYDPFDYKELHHMEGLQLCGKGEAAKLVADGVTARDGNMPICPSGGALGVGNPIAATGLMKIIEIFLQLRGEAGKRQVPGNPEVGLAQAWGDLMQVGTVAVMRK